MESQKINIQNFENIRIKEFDFEIDEFKKYCLIKGLDEIGLILEEEKKNNMISNFEIKQGQEQSWL